MVRKATKTRKEKFATTRDPAFGVTSTEAQVPTLNRSMLFTEIGNSGLERTGGTVREEFLRELQGDKGRRIYKEMRENHPVVAAVLFSIEMALRQVRWYFESTDPNDTEAIEFLESCLDDMSFTWSDTVAQILTMLQYGFSIFELVYKIRRGVMKDSHSKFDDGRIGWRKWLQISQDTLQSGDEWVFDESGGIQAVRQKGSAPTYIAHVIPMQKALLFRTTVAKNNPEGRSILRSMYQPWYYSKNMMEIEGIAAERMGAGIPTVYLGEDTNKDSTSDSDLALAKKIVRDVRMDEQMGVVIPYPKMGGGAGENKGMLFELVASPGKGMVDFNTVIERYDKRIAMVALAQFIMLGMEQVGSYALAKEQGDLFTLALSAWAESISFVVNRFAVERLLELNPTLSHNGVLTLAHSEVGVPDLATISEYINKLVGAKVLTPDEGLEKTLREKAQLPEKPEDVIFVGDKPEPTSPILAAAGMAEKQPIKQGDGAPIAKGTAATTEGAVDTDSERSIKEHFAQLRRAPGGALYETATNDYQQALSQAYKEWYLGIVPKLDKTQNSDEWDAVLVPALLVLENQLKRLGRDYLLQAAQFGAGDHLLTGGALSKVADSITTNDAFIENSLIVALRDKVRMGLADPLLKVGGQDAIQGLFQTLEGRVASYSGEFWANIWRGLGDAVQNGEGLNDRRIQRVLDPHAQHCDSCPGKARIYDNWDALEFAQAIPIVHPDRCWGNCRCYLQVETAPGSGNFTRM